MIDLEEVWRLREEVVYPALFGPVTRGIFPLDQGLFARFGDAAVDPRWLTHGVLEFAPHEDRKSWLYASSGLSNPWDVAPEDYDPAGETGAGIEFIMETEVSADWAIRVLQNMVAYDLLLAAGQFGDRPPIGLHNRIPLGGAIDGQDNTVLRAVKTIRPPEFQDDIALPSGSFSLMEFVGISEAEVELGKAEGGDALFAALQAADALPVTRPTRASIV